MYETLIGVFIFLSVMVVFVATTCHLQYRRIIKYKTHENNLRDNLIETSIEASSLANDNLTLVDRIRDLERKIKADVIPCVQEVFDCMSKGLWNADTNIHKYTSEDDMKYRYPFSWSCQRLDCLVAMLNDINDI